jgi:hypothetical protein
VKEFTLGTGGPGLTYDCWHAGCCQVLYERVAVSERYKMAVTDQSDAYQNETVKRKSVWVRELWPVLLVTLGFLLTAIWIGGLVWIIVRLIVLAWAHWPM